MNRFAWALLAPISVLLGAADAGAASADLPLVNRTAVLDGRVSGDEVKSPSANLALTVQGSIDKPRDATAVVAWRTTETLYLGFVCEDHDPKSIVTQTKEGGPVFQDDSVQVLLAPFADAARDNYFHFAVNAAGARYSNSMADDQPVLGWKSAVARTDKGWECEIAISLAAIKARDDVRFWRINLARERPARGGESEEASTWSNPGPSLHNFRRFGYLILEDANGVVPRATMAPDTVRLADEDMLRRSIPTPSTSPFTSSGSATPSPVTPKPAKR